MKCPESEVAWRLQRQGHPSYVLNNAAFAARVRQARTAARYPVDEMALLLGVTRDTYNKYEDRGASLTPHNLIVPFCLPVAYRLNGF
jgi:DNA-binding XRE family transcriptional regulator